MYILIVKCNGFYFLSYKFYSNGRNDNIRNSHKLSQCHHHQHNHGESVGLSLGEEETATMLLFQPCNINVFSLIVKCNGFYFLSYKFYSKGRIDNIRNSHKKTIPKFKTKPMSSSQTQSWRTTGTVSR